MEDGDYNSPTIQEKILQLQAHECKNGTSAHSGWCPTTWDGILCWQSTPPGEAAVQPCPHYIAGFDLQANATKQCTPEGQWYWSSEFNGAWSNYTRCYRDQLVTVLMDMPELQSDNVTSIEKYLPMIKYISKVGYAVSFSTLVVAFCILASIKKLRCQRNILHMHLFASFMVRAFMFLLKSFLFVAGVGLSTDVLIKNGESYWLSNQVESNWHCKAFTSIWQYCILANYSWILMEGLYLHNLIFCALFADANASIAGYIVLGWGLPALFVITWVILRALFENVYCWTTHDDTLIFQMIRVPITFSVVINFILFVNIVRVLLSKLKSTVSEDTMRYKRWARSTLVLVPLFGVHYSIFLGMSYSIGINETVELVWLFCDQLFASFQGFFVAVLYCFLNGEVRAELSRALRARKWPRLSRLCRARPSTHSGSTCSCNTTTAQQSGAMGCGQTRGRGSSGGYEGTRGGLLGEYCCCCWSWWRSLLAACCCRHTARSRHHRSSHSMASTQDIGIATRGGSLASSRGYLEIAGSPPPPTVGTSALSTCHHHRHRSEDSAMGDAVVASQPHHHQHQHHHQQRHHHHQQPHQHHHQHNQHQGQTTSFLLAKDADRSYRQSCCSNMSEIDATITSSTSAAVAAVDNSSKCDEHQICIRDEHGWSDSECCHLAYELHHLHRHGSGGES